ncbi:MAG: CDP-diacylglycerol--serine O-phosphatidyltransferase [Thermoplasmatales archaeon]|nr:CDP-diacylglycerol--serine O-phosphatidyltransferase [Thermoplasmatales archaeon]
MRVPSIIKLMSAADLFTVVNALLGFTAIICVVKNKIDFAIMLILLAILADGVDGFVARRFSKKWEIGDYLDIMADTISFCVAPAVLIFALYYNNGFKIFVILSCLIFLASGVLRLARFCYLHESKKFTGLPAPGAALIVSLLSALRMHPVIVIISTILLSFLMISDIKYPKTRGKTGLLSGGIVLTTIASMFFSFHTEVILPITLIFAISYGFCSPLTLKLGKNR